MNKQWIAYQIKLLWCKIKYIEQNGGGTGGGGIQEIIAGSNITVDNTDPKKPIISSNSKSTFSNDVLVSLPDIAPGIPGRVGKYLDGSIIPSAGKTYEEVLNMIAQDTKNASIVQPSFSFSKNDSTSVLEIGTNYSTNLTASYSPGGIYGKLISGVWQTANTPANKQADRAGALVSFNIDGTAYTDLVNPKTVTVNRVISNGNNNIAGSVTFAAGTAKPKRSDGTEYDTVYTSPLTLSGSITVTGMIPYFYGYIENNQNIDNVNISNFTKVIQSSTGTISLNYSNVVGKKLVVVIPQASSLKTKWYVDALNNGAIGNTGDLFSVPVTKNYNSPSSLWSNQPFRVYISTPTSLNGVIQLLN